MKKKVQLLLALAILLLVCGFLNINGGGKLQLELSEDNNLSLLLTANNKQERIYPWLNEEDDRYYFFLPAYCKSDDISFKLKEDKDILLIGMPMHLNNKFAWREEDIYQLEIRAGNVAENYNIIFLKSENLPAVFIKTDSGDMEYINSYIGNEEQGNLDIITAKGNVEYSGRLLKISGRGNSTWKYEKKPYSIELKEKKSLLGMESGDKWKLLAGVFEGAKMNDKLAFDMAELLGLNSPQCSWVDLYLNGKYAGIYFLTESVSVGEGRVDITDLEKQNKANNPNIEEANIFETDGMKGYIINNGDNISGGYLFEKDIEIYWETEGAGFTTSGNNRFTIKSPQHASGEQVEYLAQYVQKIDDMLNGGNVEYRNYIDFESFAKKFLVDEIALSHDVNVTSMYYYKEKNDDLLYAGPVWDFDGAFGESNQEWLWGFCVDYENSCVSPFRGEMTLNWYAKLYDDEEFRSRVIELYNDALPRIEELVETRIDIYADYIRKSVELDMIRWENIDLGAAYPGHFTKFDNNVRYLKYFLANRLNYLNERWNVDYDDLALPDYEGTHEITFWLDGEVIETREIADGEVLEQLPYLDEDVFLGWYFTYSGERYRVHLPIYEDIAFYARRK